MATITEEWQRLKFLAEHGRGDEKCHIVFIEQEAKERIANTKAKTKFVLETDSPDAYSRFNELKDRWFAAINKSVAISLWLKLLDRPTEWIKEMADDKTR